MSDHTDGEASSLVAPLPEHKTWRNHLGSVAKAGVNAIPFVGGTLGSLWSDYLPQAGQAKVQAFLEDTAERINRLTEAQQQAVLTDEFAHLFTESLRSVAFEYRAEKIAATPSRTQMGSPTTPTTAS